MKKKLPEAILQYVNQQETIPVSPPDEGYPYSSYPWKATASILLSGRIKPKMGEGLPNLTDVNRFCKEANFNQYYFNSMASFLLSSRVIETHGDYYKKGKHFQAFWGDDFSKLHSIAHQGLLALVGQYTPFNSWRPAMAFDSDLIQSLILFFAGFEGRALRFDQIGELFLAFSQLPEKALMALANNLAIKATDLSAEQWQSWLDPKGQQALVRALFDAGWAYVDNREKVDWFVLNHTGRILLGLETPPPRPVRGEEFKVLPNCCIFAGADLPVDTLAPLFRYCKTKRIDRVFEFQVNRETMNEIPSRTSAGRELLKVLKDLEPLPPAVRSLLEDKPTMGGVLRYQVCSALIKPENPAMLAEIRKHSKLKGYLESGGPPGYLLVKSTSSAGNFIRRCHEYGFQIKPL